MQGFKEIIRWILLSISNKEYLSYPTVQNIQSSICRLQPTIEKRKLFTSSRNVASSNTYSMKSSQRNHPSGYV